MTTQPGDVSRVRARSLDDPERAPGEDLPDIRIGTAASFATDCTVCQRAGRAYLDHRRYGPVVVHQRLASSAPDAPVVARWACRMPPPDRPHPEASGGREAAERAREGLRRKREASELEAAVADAEEDAVLDPEVVAVSSGPAPLSAAKVGGRARRPQRTGAGSRATREREAASVAPGAAVAPARAADVSRVPSGRPSLSAMRRSSR